MDPSADPTFPPELSFDDLPLWMRQARRRVDWGLLLALLLGLLSVWPFLIRGGLPHGTALELYVYRTAEMADVIRDGGWYPRWAPNLLYGYGLPLFNYVAPGSVYPAALFQITTEGSAVDGVRFSLIVEALIGAAGLFAFVRRRWGPVAGLVAVGAFKLSPGLLFLFPYVYGDLPLLDALQLLPAVFWALDRVLIEGQGKSIGYLAGTLALLLLADERTAPWLLLMVVGWLLWLGIFDRRRGYGWAWVGIALGCGLSALFWVPLLTEQDMVHWLIFSRPSFPPLTIGELLAPSVALDLGAFNPLVRRNLGLVIWLFALGAAIGVLVNVGRRRRSPQDWWWLYFALLTAALLVTAVAGGLDPEPPYLLLGLLIFPLAVTAARVVIGLEWLRQGWPRRLGLALLIGLPVLNAFPILYPPDWSSDFGSTDALARLQPELDEYSLATVPPGQAIPLPFANVPLPARPLLESYAIGRLDKVNRSALTSGRVDLIEHTAISERLLVLAPNPIDIPLYISSFAGWSATVDGQVVAPETDAAGLLRVRTPSGEHEVHVYFGETAAGTLGVALSLLSALATLLVIGAASRQTPPTTAEAGPAMLSGGEVRVAGVTLGLLLLALPVLIGSPGVFWQRSPRGVVLEGGTPFRRYTQVGLDILAYNVPRSVYAPGERVEITLYWRAVRPPSDNFQVTVSLVGSEDGYRAVQSYKRHVADYPTTRWPRDRYVRDWHMLTVPEDLTPGVYLLVVELWQCPTGPLGGCQQGQRIEFFGSRGASVGQSLALPMLVTVSPE